MHDLPKCTIVVNIKLSYPRWPFNTFPKLPQPQHQQIVMLRSLPGLIRLPQLASTTPLDIKDSHLEHRLTLLKWHPSLIFFNPSSPLTHQYLFQLPMQLTNGYNCTLSLCLYFTAIWQRATTLLLRESTKLNPHSNITQIHPSSSQMI